MNQKPHIGTLCVQAGYNPGKGEPRQIPVIQSTTFKYETSDQMGRLFDLEDSGYFYTRLQNPTNDMVAAKIAALEGGVGAMLTSSGQAANFFACFNICEAGDHMIATNNIYGGTFNLFGVTFRKMGIDVTFIDYDASDEQIDAAFKPNTKLIFTETIANPGVQVLDIERFAARAHAHGVPMIIDNTFATPVHCRPIEFGADIVTHSTTKYMDGHGTTVGGVIVDSGNFDWMAHADKFPGLCTPDASYHGIVYAEKFGRAAFITKCTTHLMRDLGSIQAPQNAFYLNLGLQTLHVRMKHLTASALKVATFLKNHPAVAWIHYPDLPGDSQYEMAKKYLPEGSCGVMAFALKGGRAVDNKFMDSLKLVTIETHVADCYTCILHPASHTHRQLSDEQLREAGIAPDLMRLSIGLEDPEDIIADLAQAIETATGK
ncbi:MAG: O-acetylhomoserine aminocarboxypropyltransferase/cysteine synthase [Bacteroidales bacterium]|nr:O-acetylhomoserine aminocarboxypropyltransferase/cysteine synthase [Bacteroidales bacterium]